MRTVRGGVLPEASYKTDVSEEKARERGEKYQVVMRDKKLNLKEHCIQTTGLPIT